MKWIFSPLALNFQTSWAVTYFAGLPIEIVLSKVIISELTPRNGQLKKAKEVNEVLNWKCNKRNIGVKKHDNMNARRHCNMSGSHLNCKDANIRIENILFN